MFIAAAVALLCAVLLVGGLVRVACRYRSDLWITSDDAILCVVSPVMILLGTAGAAALGYRLTHGGLAAVPVGGWIGSAAIATGSVFLYVFVAARLRGSERRAAEHPVEAPLATR